MEKHFLHARTGARIQCLGDTRRGDELGQWLAGLFVLFLVLPYDREAADWQARERVRLERAGRPVPFVDAQIAAIAAVRGLTLVTANTRDFERFEGLSVEDWS